MTYFFPCVVYMIQTMETIQRAATNTHNTAIKTVPNCIYNYFRFVLYCYVIQFNVVENKSNEKKSNNEESHLKEKYDGQYYLLMVYYSDVTTIFHW